jgi:hypothetical protein
MPFRLVLILSAVSLVLLAASVGGVYALALLIEGLASPTTVSPISVRIALSCAFLALALVLYIVKKTRYQFAYGFVEVAIGLVANWQSLDSWFHPASSTTGVIHIIWARMAILAGGTYLISKGISNAIEGFLKFFPASVWQQIPVPNLGQVFSDGMTKACYQPTEGVPTKHLRINILIVQRNIEKLEKKLAARLKVGKNTDAISETLPLLRAQLQTLMTRYETEVVGQEKIIDKPVS